MSDDSRGAISITTSGLCYRIGERPILQQIDLTIPAGDTLALLGPSGCGKSTLLKLLAGLLQPEQGRISFGELRVADAHYSLPPEQRNLGMVFQDYALWPHMSVGQNVGFPLQMRAIPRPQRHQRVLAALARVGLADFAERRPAELSGGQQQRVALARAIVAEPRVLLFDEPLSNLDRDLRESLSHEMATLLRQLRTTAVYVTHDRNEAAVMAHRVAHIAGGRIAEITSL
ncbi:Spermidine/putrescine import ATP-binding protein PotA [Serratia proteamaculans]|uniref:ABC transporter ATP-binding protein n=1 Tax=Serratia proteamaculans TaxID=28151 RepID=UPI0021785975|nr:ABC transporter ATP-binding protein [Serratia proteamaculans]CAI0782797.1 Spermidine/putrescine import ATP-binding protein PotA [Serratia proteamaculans]CAI1571577.1 Spermidine/putrescine import ATP-binding protein PotA [Serratia proteamaculans]